MRSMGRSIHQLNSVVDEIFRTMEEIRCLFLNWNASCSTTFIEKVMHLNVSREHLNKLGYDDDFIETVIKIVYHTVFTKAERMHYAGR
jgi:hypothetical protein